jgi:tRNA pseudouridine55 synthase
MTAPDGLLVVDKPAGWTSHDVVAKVRRLSGTRKVGHAGTLDPMATGVLVVGIGRATRLLGLLATGDKAYDATIRLGETTVTDDAEGEPLAAVDTSHLEEPAIREEMTRLTGDLFQVPSAVSAVKVEGRRAYQRVRDGEDVRLAPRQVRVTRFDLAGLHRHAGVVDLEVHVECSTGTYVRALARDLGDALGVGGHLTALRRTRVGSYGLEVARTIEQHEQALAVIGLDEAAARSFPVFPAPDDLVAGIRNGRPFTAHLGGSGPVAVLAPDGRFLALYEQHGPVAKPVAVFAPA